jgi:CRISPR-associated protein Cmr6
LPAQTKPQQAWRQIEDVFGWAPASDRGKDWKPADVPERPKDDNARVSAVVFHDAWPTAWPSLIVDIVNNHHPDYYQHDDNDHPPGVAAHVKVSFFGPVSRE